MMVPFQGAELFASRYMHLLHPLNVGLVIIIPERRDRKVSDGLRPFIWLNVDMLVRIAESFPVVRETSSSDPPE